MALNIKTLGTRALSAFVFVVVLLTCLLWNYYSFTVFFFVVAIIGLNEFYNLSANFKGQPYKGVGFVSAVLLYLSFLSVDYFFLPLINLNLTSFFVILVPFVILAVAMFTRRENPVQNSLFTVAGIIYAVLPFGLLHKIIVFPAEEGNGVGFEPRLIFGVILLIWGNDTFAYLGGSLFGKHKMIERISPGKTWEGTLTGIFLSFFASFFFNTLVYQGGAYLWPVLGLLVPVLATIGDLVESMIKRQAGIKDTGNLMPGHGGILDRFDSLIFVTPFVLVILKLIA